LEFIDRSTQANTPSQIIADLTSVEGDFDLGVLYVSPGSSYDPLELSQAIRQKMSIRHLIGCTCAGIIGAGREIEGTPSAALMLVRMGQVKITPFI